MARGKFNKKDLIKMANDSRKSNNKADYIELELQMLNRRR